MRASRLFTMVLLLQSRGSMTAAELAGELSVSERTVYRDVVELAAAGVPVYGEQGRLGGYRLVDGYRTRLTGLSRDEAEALFLLGLGGPARDMGLGDLLTTARLKVLAALPAPLRDASAQAAQRFHLDVPGWFDDRDTPPALADLARAVWQDLVVVLRYRRRDAEVSRTVHPYGLVLKGGVWYLLARVEARRADASGDHDLDSGPDAGPQHDTGGQGEASRRHEARAGRETGGRGEAGRRDDRAQSRRVYRVDRIVDVEVTGEQFGRAEGFDLPAEWAARAEEFVHGMLAEEIVVRLSAEGLRLLRYAVEPPANAAARDAAGAPDGQGRVVTRLPVESLEVAYTQLLRLGPEVEVLEPETLRARMRAAAVRAAALYAHRPPTITW